MPLYQNILVALVLLLLAVPGRAQEAQVVVRPEGPVTTVTEALERVERGGRVVVDAGTYREPTIIVRKPVTIEGRGEAVLDGEGERAIMLVATDSVTIRGLTFVRVPTSYVHDLAAIKVDSARHVAIEHNRFDDTFFGIYLAQTADAIIRGNALRAYQERESRAANGIHLWYSKDVTIENNTVRGHRDGIYLEFVEDADVRGNLAEHNLRYGLHFMFSDRCVYRENTFRDNDAGVAVMYTANVEMTGNVFEQNWGSAAYGLLLKDITDSVVSGNRFYENTVGMHVEGTNRVDISDNELVKNGWAVKIMANAEDNHFTGNDFVANTFDVATNSRQHYSTFDGNYWDKYDGYDLDRDGVGDVPFRPVRLFSLIVARNEPALLLLHSFFVELLDAAERVIPALTPETLVDRHPMMQRTS